MEFKIIIILLVGMTLAGSFYSHHVNNRVRRPISSKIINDEFPEN